jgi:hypothetical protein
LSSLHEVQQTEQILAGLVLGLMLKKDQIDAE